MTEPKSFSEIDYDHLYRVGKVIFFEEDISVESPKYAYRYGFWNTNNNAIVKSTYHGIDMKVQIAKLVSRNYRTFLCVNNSLIIFTSWEVLLL